MAAHTIAEVQTALNRGGFGPIDVDGVAGAQTDGAVSKFQTARGLTATGTLDPETLAALFPGAALMLATVELLFAAMLMEPATSL